MYLLFLTNGLNAYICLCPGVPNKLPYYREVRLTPEGVQVGSVHVTVGID